MDSLSVTSNGPEERGMAKILMLLCCWYQEINVVHIMICGISLYPTKKNQCPDDFISNSIIRVFCNSTCGLISHLLLWNTSGEHRAYTKFSLEICWQADLLILKKPLVSSRSSSIIEIMFARNCPG